ncbi:hypothetical protein GCM10020331_099210 [Ectobacillus funiculus]
MNKITKDSVDQYVHNKQNILHAPKQHKHPIELGFVQVGTESSWRAANSSSIKKRLLKTSELNLNLKKMPTKVWKIKSRLFEVFIRERVDVIAFSPVVQTGYEDVLREAKMAGIPVILTDRELGLKDDSLWLTSIGSDFQEEGRRAARWLFRTN